MNKAWTVSIPKKVQKSISKLPVSIKKQTFVLLQEIKLEGPNRWNWKNYGKLEKDIYHCHIKSGHPTYVCCWKILPILKFVEIFYVGTHENAPY